MPGARAPAATCAEKSTRVSHHEYAGTPGIPARNGFNGFLRAPRRSGLFVTVASGLRFVGPGRGDLGQP